MISLSYHNSYTLHQFLVFRDDLKFFMLYYLFINKCLVDLISGPILKGVLLTWTFLIISVLRNWIMPLNIILITCKQINKYQHTNSLVRKISMLVTLNGEMCFKCYLCTFIWFLYISLKQSGTWRSHSQLRGHINLSSSII